MGKKLVNLTKDKKERKTPRKWGKQRPQNKMVAINPNINNQIKY